MTIGTKRPRKGTNKIIYNMSETMICKKRSLHFSQLKYFCNMKNLYRIIICWRMRLTVYHGNTWWLNFGTQLNMPSKHKRLNQCYFMLEHRLRQGTSIKVALVQRLLLAGWFSFNIHGVHKQLSRPSEAVMLFTKVADQDRKLNIESWFPPTLNLRIQLSSNKEWTIEIQPISFV